MVCFLGTDLFEILKNVLKRFIKEDIIAGFSVSALGSIDVEKIENQKAYSEYLLLRTIEVISQTFFSY